MDGHHVEPVNQNLRLIACPHLLSIEKDRIDVQRPSGGSVSDLMRSIGWTPAGLSARVFLDGELVKDAAWGYTVPQSGQSLVVRAIPMGGENGKSALRIVAMIAIMVAAIATQQYWALPLAGMIGTSVAVAGAIGMAAISLVGTLAITAKIPPAHPRLCDQRQVQHG